MKDFTLEEISKIAYSTLKKYCNILGENHLPYWANLTQDLRNIVGLAVDFIDANSEAITAEQLHLHTNRLFVRFGWSYSSMCSLQNHNNSMMIQFKSLSKEQIMKYDLFIAVVKTFLK